MFRTTEISDPKFESNHLRFITIKSKNLKGRGDICLFVPPGKVLEEVPLVILLHGVYGSSWVWTQKGGVHITALDMMSRDEIKPMVIAMPSDGLWGDGSAYLAHNNRDFEQWIVNDVRTAVINNIEGVTKKSKVCIGGLSMGGFGALRLGIKYSGVFSAISAHSAITAIDQMPLFVEEPLQNFVQDTNEENAVLPLAISKKNNLPKIRFDCGREDLLIDHNRALHQGLLENAIEHKYEEFSGAHEWPYWQEHIKDSLRFFNSTI
ncbi:MAG: alpha/beta hydrolase [Flavobacteriaceae bacterium]